MRSWATASKSFDSTRNMSQEQQCGDGSYPIEASNGEMFPGDIYTETTKSVGTQREVAHWWENGHIAPHQTSGRDCLLRSKTGNFKGYQSPDGSGLLKHYNHIEAIRTRSGMILSDTECYARGWAKCTKPTYAYSLPLTTIQANIRNEDFGIYDIVDVEEHENGSIVTFENGETYVVGEIHQ